MTQPTDNSSKKQKRTPSDTIVRPRPIPKEQTDAIRARIKEIRGKASRESFGERAGLSESTLRSYEEGVSVPHDVIACLAFAGGVTTDWLITGREPKHRRAMMVQTLGGERAPSGLSAMQYIKGSDDPVPPQTINSALLRNCLAATKTVHGEDFSKAIIPVQLEYACDFYNQLVNMAVSKVPPASVNDFCRIEIAALADQLRFFIQIGWARKFPSESDLPGNH